MSGKSKRILLTHRLRHPIYLTTKPADGEHEVEEEIKPAGFCVVVKRPRAKDMALMDGYYETPMKGALVMLTRLSNLDETEVENLDAEDFDFLAEVSAPNTDAGTDTGETD